ncbi:hypothetical protein ACO1O0_000522 [Amphichorda felina]
MPWGVQRLNTKKSQPNANIVFIKPLSGPDEKIAQDFLERIAAQCLPVMREHHLYVMSLEEFPANREFVGRNFNAGEVIQLVLRSPSSGRWLPFEYVQMVMMHELAHCKQMNHSRAFWAVRNAYAAQMRALWDRGYTGDGIWGRGATLATGQWEKNTVREGEILPEHLCGGTFRSRGRKRKARPTLSYQERKERRIQKKFGKNGVALGADDEVKVKLEKGKRVQAKPRVAGSARGRELRAAAALARFEQQKGDKAPVKDEDETASGSESDYDDSDWPDLDSKDAIDVDGARLVDGKGRGMVKVCEDEAPDDPGAKNELEELQNVFRRKGIKRESPEPSLSSMPTNIPTSSVKKEPRSTFGGLDNIPPVPSSTSERIPHPTPKLTTRRIKTEPENSAPATRHILENTGQEAAACSMCSFINPPAAVTCSLCANVLDPKGTPNCWRCPGATCKDSAYRNSGDCGICGLCGQKRPSQP